MTYDVIVVGSGMAGLTASAFAAKARLKVLLCEKEETCGGLVNTFVRDGFVYDGGIRALENSGVLFPMLKALGVKVDFVKNQISIGIEDQIIRINSEENISDYQLLLNKLYPENMEEISQIVSEMRKIMHYMGVQYGIDNPVFMDMKKDREYLLKVILPWLFQYILTAPKIAKLDVPVEDFLRRFTGNISLIDIIAQHFFHNTPAFFALSYIKLYNDYHYPVGGTGKIIETLLSFIKAHQGTVKTNTQIVEIDPIAQQIKDTTGNAYTYKRLIWAADQKTFYRMINLDALPERKTRQAIDTHKKLINDKAGNDSIFTLYLGVNLPREYFSAKVSEHLFYTPNKIGQTQAGELPCHADRAEIENWLKKFFTFTTYEISCPVMRDATLAPAGKTGLIISVLFDYKLTKTIEAMGWYTDFKAFCETCILDVLDASIFPGIKAAIVHKFSSTPLSMEKYSGNADGAITGWAFSNHPIPAESRIPKIMNAVKTPVPHVVQAGQWTYSPSGLPISIITGKIAADKVIKDLG